MKITLKEPIEIIKKIITIWCSIYSGSVNARSKHLLEPCQRHSSMDTADYFYPDCGYHVDFFAIWS